MKLIGLDVGEKRIGVAKADTNTRIAVPDGFITVNGQEFSEIARLSRMYGTKVFIIGLPRNNSGEETKQSAYVRDFAHTLAQTISGAKIYFQDESLTSVEAEERLKSRKKSYKKGEIDAEAATIILQDCIERFSANGNAPDSAPEALEGASGKKASSRSASTPEPPKIAPESSKKGSKSKKKSSNERKTGKTIAIIAGIIVLVLGLVCGGGLIWYNVSLSSINKDGPTFDTDVPTEIEGCKTANFSVEKDQSVSQVSSNLKTAGLIRSAFAFQIYALLNGYSSSLQVGEYEFSTCMDAPTIAQKIAKGEIIGNTFDFTILPGETVKDVKTKLVKIGYKPEEVDIAFSAHYNHPVLAGLYNDNGELSNPAQPREVQLEGYLYGETYQFYKGESVENIIRRVLDELNEVVKSNDLIAKYESVGLSLREGIILASIIQKEAKSGDMPGVAQVFLNRLRTGMSLGSDVTATYAANLADPNRSDLNNNSSILNNDSLYNTRRWTGLPPGPISSPGTSALLSVANPDPARSSDYYFLTGDDGVMYYSTNSEGHEQNRRDHCQKLCSVAL